MQQNDAIHCTIVHCILQLCLYTIVLYTNTQNQTVMIRNENAQFQSDQWNARNANVDKSLLIESPMHYNKEFIIMLINDA